MAGRSRPTAALQPYVQSYIDFDMSGWPPGVHRGLPDGSVSVVVTLEGEIGTSPGPEAAAVSAPAVVGGIVAGPTFVAHDGRARGVQLDLTPRGARVLLGLPAAAVATGIWALDDVIGARAGVLAERLAAAGGSAGRTAVLDDELLGWRRDGDGYPAAVDEAWQRIRGSGGTVGVAALADASGWSRRHLTELVRTELGVTPKAAARIFRFKAARRRLARGEDLAGVAVACGYFDQAHLANEWKRLAGCTTGAWLAEELPFLQDAGADGSA